MFRNCIGNGNLYWWLRMSRRDDRIRVYLRLHLHAYHEFVYSLQSSYLNQLGFRCSLTFDFGCMRYSLCGAWKNVLNWNLKLYPSAHCQYYNNMSILEKHIKSLQSLRIVIYPMDNYPCVDL